MATEVTVKIRDSNIGQAFFVKQEEWDLCLNEIRGILFAQDVETPSEYRFLTGNGNVVSTTLETTITFRDIVESEPFAEIKKEDTSLHSAERRVIPQIVVIPVGESVGQSSSQGTERQCPFINHFPCFEGVRGTLPCMRNVLNVHTLLKVAFLLTCLLFLMIFVLTLGVHLLFGIGAVSGFTGHGFLGGLPLYPHQQAASFADQEAVTALKVKLSEMEVAHGFEIRDLKQKLAELEDMHLSQFRDLEAMRKELAAATTNLSTSQKQYAGQMDNLSVRLSTVEDSMTERWQPEHTVPTMASESEEIIVESEEITIDRTPPAEAEKGGEIEVEGDKESEIDGNVEEEAAAEEKKKEEKKKNNKDNKKKNKKDDKKKDKKDDKKNNKKGEDKKKEKKNKKRN